MYSSQKEEIATIKERTINIKLSDADVARVSKLAGSHGLTVEQLLENFIGDLVDGTYTNGSDERDMAERWFRRCWFGMFPDNTFLHFLIEWDYIDDALEYWESISEHEENIKKIEEELTTGVMKSWNGNACTWKELVTSSTDGDRPSYSSKEEWENEEREELEQENVELAFCREQLADFWKEYTEEKKDYQQGTFEEEWKKVREWNEHYLSFIAEHGFDSRENQQ